jgi:hypothetical protein
MSDLQQRGLEASDRKTATRLDRQSTPTPDTEVAIYNGRFNPTAAQGERYWVESENGPICGEFISPSAPLNGTRVAVYSAGNGHALFDVL